MASFAFNSLHQLQFHLSSFSHCKRSSTLQFRPSFRSLCVLNREKQAGGAQLSREAVEEPSRSGVSKGHKADFNSGLTDKSKWDSEKLLERRDVPKDRNEKNGVSSKRRRVVGSGDSSTRIKGRNLVRGIEKGGIFDEKNGVNMVENEKRAKKSKIDPPETTLRIGLDTCSKRGDVLGAIKLYDLAKRDGIKMGQYHYAVLLYLCSSAATGTVQPAKSGSGGRSLSSTDPVEANSVVGSESVNEFGEMANWMNGVPVKVDGNDISSFVNGTTENFGQTLEGLVQEMRSADYCKCDGIQMSNDVKRVALWKGFEIYNDMCLNKVPMNEATLTSVARMALAFGDGDTAFDMVNQMIEHGISPRLRSYGPALTIFCSNGDVEKAFMVEKHMLTQGIHPEEPELEALLRVSVETGKSDKVYYVLHRLRTNVRQVSEGTADLIERWFKSKVASRVGKRRWDKQMIAQAMENGGGGWHGNGWLGQGKWTVCRSLVDSDGSCKSCGEKLATIDLDPLETENFAKSVASFALQMEKNSSFQKFQKWLDYYGPFEAVVDAANVGLYSQRNFKPSKVNAVVNGIRQMLPSRKWPLIVLHHRRIKGDKMDKPFNRSLIEKWRNGDALYATPTGSNDDWYWLYAAIKCKCLIVTNDEMRDHLFQLLGNDFFPKWKERHQVHFTFTETGPVFHMPPACSIVIQESEKGHWHIPLASEVENEDERTWLCCTRSNSGLQEQDSSDEPKVSRHGKQARSGKSELEELRQNTKSVVLTSAVRNRASIIPELVSAEEIGDHVIDFQI